MTEIVIALIGILATVISNVLTYILTKKKYNAEVDSKVIQNLKDGLDFYKTLCDDNSKKLEEYRRESEALRKQVMELQAQVLDMSLNLCYEATCTARKLKKELDQTKKRGSGNGSKTEKNS